MTEINNLENVRELLRSKGANVNRRERARRTGVPIGLIERIYRAGVGRTWTTMPTDAQIEQIARYASLTVPCTEDEVYRSFEKDRYPQRTGDLYDALNKLLLLILAQPPPERQETIKQLEAFVSAPEAQRREIGSFVAKIIESVE